VDINVMQATTATIFRQKKRVLFLLFGLPLSRRGFIGIIHPSFSLLILTRNSGE